VLNVEFTGLRGQNAFKHFVDFVSHFLQCHKAPALKLGRRPNMDHGSNEDQVSLSKIGREALLPLIQKRILKRNLREWKQRD